MDPSGWQKLWQKHYNNKSDERWKTKSLNPMPVEQYSIPLPKVPTPALQPPDTKGGKREKADPSNQEVPLPSPKMNKINDTMFCISMERDVHLFYLVTNQEEKAKQKVKKIFGMISYTLASHEPIEQVTGNGSNLIFVKCKNSLTVLEIMDSKLNGTKDSLQLRFSKPITDLITIFTSDYYILALSATHLYQFDIIEAHQIKEVLSKKIDFPSQKQENLYKTLMPVGIVTGSGRSLYYFGSRVEEQIDISKLKGAPGEETERKMKSEALTIVKLSVVGEGKVDQVRGKVYPIDHIFELGIFTRSKIYEIEKETFLLSLHEEVILIKENFEKYIVWDNVSVVSSKSQSKKGQLILADKNILVYSENVEIFAHEIFFNDSQSKLNMPAIDNFKGNDNDEQILYDALLLFYEDSIMKVLAYIKPSTVVYPSNQYNTKKRETDPNKAKDEPTQLQFTIICISQSDPKKKLEQLIEKGKTNQEIEAFCNRFNISKQDETKSRWNVSDKKLKDIENILMEIQEDKFIQTELDNILKKQSHNLDFLSAVEAKQISRLSRLLVDRIIAYSDLGMQNSEEAQKLLTYIYEILQWYLQSEMFLKKVTYSKNFLSFKEYDFIEIGKLKAASLKEEIKLLSSKKYEKRLKYFLNSFKILVIANFEEVFGFLMDKKSIAEIFTFIHQFKFILPTFEEPSAVFIQQRDYKIFVAEKSPMLENPTPAKRERALSFAAGANDDIFQKINERSKERDKDKQKGEKAEKAEREKEKGQKAEKDQRCMLWDPLEQSDMIPETMECFQEKIVREIRAATNSQGGRERAVKKFKKILQNFTSNKWFESAAFKQHSMITKTTKEVHAEFKQLKRKGAFKILIKILYHRIAELGPEAESAINKNLEDQLIKHGIIPESFKRNVDARVLVYRQLLERKQAMDGKRLLGLELPLLEDFIIKSEEKYFDFLFRNIRDRILKEVKDIYDNIEVGFFRERFQMFLESSLISPDDIIEFMDSFTEDVTADEIRIDVFNAIKRLLRLSDKPNTRNYINKIMDREVLPGNDDNQTGKLREEAKIPYGFFFFSFFRTFSIDYSYKDFIAFTNTPLIKDCLVIQELVGKYCRGEYKVEQDFSGNTVCVVHFEDGQGIHERIPDVDIHNQPLEFFGLVLHLLDVLDFEIEEREVFELMLQNYLREGKFSELSDFIRKLREYHVTENNLHTNNYKMISDFKEEIDADRHFIDYTLSWIKRNYDAINSPAAEAELMRSNQSALNMLTKFNRNAPQIKQEKSLFQLISSLRRFDSGMIVNVEALKKEAISNSSFIFLMRRLNQIGLDRFRNYANNEEWMESLNNFSEMFQAHKQYALHEVTDPSHPDFLRFLIELCLAMIEERIFPIAKYLIIRRIPNSNVYYFKDVMLFFLTAIKIDENRMRDYWDSIQKHILAPETTSLISQSVEDKILNYFRVTDFITVKEQVATLDKKDSKTELGKLQLMKEQGKTEVIEQSKGKMESREKSAQFVQRSLQLFDRLLAKLRKDDAFFYMVRVKSIYNSSIAPIVMKHRKRGEQERVSVEWASYMLVTSYVKALELFIEREFYPTSTFFISKVNLLQDPRERKDMIKDVNIALSKLERLSLKGPLGLKGVAERHCNLTKQELSVSYNDYMTAIGEDPDIRLAEGETKGIQATKSVEMYSRKTDLLAEQNRQQIQYKKDLQRNLEKVNKLQEDNRINVMQREISQKITEIKKVNERHTLLEAEQKKEIQEESLAARRERQLQAIRRQEKQDLESIKDTYKSNTTKRVNDLIENLRKNREMAAAKRNAPTSSIRDQPRESMMGMTRPPNINQPTIAILQPPNIRSKQETIPQSPKSDLLSEHVLPITMKGKLQQIQSVKEEMKKSGGDNRLLDLQKRMFSEVPEQRQQVGKRKVVFEEISNLYRKSESEEACKHIQKYDMLKNPQVRADFIKRTYTVTHNLENLIEYLKFLLDVEDGWKESIEEKSIPIASQMIKMQKEKIAMKEVIPAEFFTTVCKMSVKDYYNHAFEIFRPNIRKIFEKEMMAVHAVGIMFRYALGSENRYYGKVFYEYFRVILKNYQLRNIDDKELTLLAEKIRSNYSSLPDSKDQVLEELLTSISNPLKKARLLEALKRTVERTGQTMAGGQAAKEIAYILQKIMK